MMARSNRPAIANRVVLAVLGSALIVGGALALAAHLGRLSWVDAHAPLVPGTAAPPTWVFWLVVAAAIVLGLLCLRWLWAQVFRMPPPESWRIESGDGAGHTVLAARTAANPVAVDIENFAAVRSASAWLTGPRDAPELYLIVTAEPDADVAELRERIAVEAVPRLRRALEVENIAVGLELRFADAGRPARLR